MAQDRASQDNYTGPLKRLLLTVLVMCLLGLFLWGLGRMEAPDSKTGRYAIGLHLLGLATSILALALFK